MTGTQNQDWLPDERAVEVAPRFAPRVGDPVPRRLNYVAGRSLTELALRTEQTWRDRRFAMLGRALEPGIIEGLELEVLDAAAGAATLRVSPGTGLTSSGEDVTLHRSLVARLDDIPPAEPLIQADEGPHGLVALLLRPVRGLAALARDPEDPCPVDPEAYSYADIVTLDGAELAWFRIDDGDMIELPATDDQLLRPVPPADGGEPRVLGPLSSRNVLLPPRPLLGRTTSVLVPQSVARNTTAQRLIAQEADAALIGEDPTWARHGLPLAVAQIDAEGNILFFDRFAVARMGGAPQHPLPSTGAGLSPALRRARFDQFVDHLQDLRAEGAALAPASLYFRTLPPIGVLPATLLNFKTMICGFFPSTYRIEAAPVPIEQFEAVLSNRAALEPYDLARHDYVQIVVPVPEHLYEPRLLLKETPAPEIAVAIKEAAIRETAKQSLVDSLKSMEVPIIGAIDVARISDPAPSPDAAKAAERRFDEEARGILTDLHADVADIPVGDEDQSAIDPSAYDAMVKAIGSNGAQSDLAFRGLKPVVDALAAKLDKANDFLDLSFVRLQADIYRARKNLLGEEDSSRLATSPVLSNLATTGTGLEASQKIFDLFLKGKRSAPQPASDLQVPKGGEGGGGAGGATAGIAPMMMMRAQPFTFNFSNKVTKSFGEAQNLGIVADSISSQTKIFSSTALTSAAVIGSSFTAFKVSLANAKAQANTIAWQGLVYGKASPVRTVTIAERLRPSPAQEAKNSAVATKAEIVRGGQALGLNLAGLAIPLSARRTALVEKAEFDTVISGFSANVQTVMNNRSAAPLADGVIVVNDAHLVASAKALFPDDSTTAADIAEAAAILFTHRAGLDLDNLSGLILADRLDPDPSDPDEGAYYAAAVDALESAVSMLRLIEARTSDYSSFVDRARDALIRLYDLSESWQGAIEDAEADLAEAVHDKTVATALWQEENQRVDAINARRADILARNVEIIAFARPRSVDRFVDAPGMDLYAPLEDPIPACLEGGDPPPEELQEMILDLREAPVGWFPALAAEVDRINRLRALIGAWTLAHDRAESWLKRAPLRATLFTKVVDQQRVAGKAATGIRLALAASHSRVAAIVTARMARPLDDLAALSWRNLRERVSKELSIDDLADAGAAGVRLNRAGLKELDQIASVAGCFLATLRETPTTIRLQWAEALSVHDDPPDLSVITRAPGWTSIAFEQRRVLEHMHRWLFARIDSGIADARGMMSEIIRVCLLLASHAPVSEIAEGRPADTKILAHDDTFEVAVATGEVAVGMIASFAGGKSGYGVIKDVVGSKATVQVAYAPQGQVAVSPADAIRFTSPVRARLIARK